MLGCMLSKSYWWKRKVQFKLILNKLIMKKSLLLVSTIHVMNFLLNI